MKFSDPLKVKISEDGRSVLLSVRVTEKKVEVHTFDASEFDVMVAEYYAQRRMRTDEG